MKYFVVADVHGFYDEMTAALNAQGFDVKNPEHMLIICGDLMDRGLQPLEMQAYVLDMLEKEKVILIRGNHEDLALEMIDNFYDYSFWIEGTHHAANGTFQTMMTLTGLCNIDEIRSYPMAFAEKSMRTDFVQKIIPKMRDYFETEHFIFVHGWFPCVRKAAEDYTYFAPKYTYSYNPNWREATEKEWEKARWFNGMECAVEWGVREPNKTVICGHKASLLGHRAYENMTEDDFSPFYGEGVIGIDGRTVVSGKVNCIVVED